MPQLTLFFSHPEAENFFYALACKTRRHILAIVAKHPLINITELAKELTLTEATTSYQVKILERLGLITASYRSARHGIAKRLSVAFDAVTLKFSPDPLDKRLPNPLIIERRIPSTENPVTE